MKLFLLILTKATSRELWQHTGLLQTNFLPCSLRLKPYSGATFTQFEILFYLALLLAYTYSYDSSHFIYPFVHTHVWIVVTIWFACVEVHDPSKCDPRSVVDTRPPLVLFIIIAIIYYVIQSRWAWKQQRTLACWSVPRTLE